MWVIILGATAAGGALMLWHAVSKMKFVCEEMLDQYAQMLVEARAKKVEQLAEDNGEDGTDDGSEPIDVS